MWRYPFFLTLLVVAAAACDTVTAPRHAAFVTDADAYLVTTTPVGHDVRIGFVFTNPNPTPVYIVNCGGSTALALQKHVGNQWIVAWSPIIPLCLSRPIVVLPLAQYRDTVHVADCSFLANCEPRFQVAQIPGEYRLVWYEVLSSFDDTKSPFGPALPLEQRVSNTFHLMTWP